MPLLDPSSDAYRVVAGIIESAHRRVGASESHRWNGQIGVLSTVSRQRSRSDLDGTIHLHPRNVIRPLTRAADGAGPRWWYPRAARDAAYNVIYEALRQSSKVASTQNPTEPGKRLDRALRPGALRLDQALSEQRTYEIAQGVLADNGLAHEYSEDPPEAAAISGHGLAGGIRPFRLNPSSTSTTAAARGFVDTVQAATGRDRDEVFNSLLTQAKTSRWSLVVQMVADQHHPDLQPDVSEYQYVSQRAVREWNRLSSFRRLSISTAPAAETWGYAIGRDTAGIAVDMTHVLARVRRPAQEVHQTAEAAGPAQGSQSAEDVAPPQEQLQEPGSAAGRKLSPRELFAAQTPFTGVEAPSSTPTTETGSPGSAPATERRTPEK